MGEAMNVVTACSGIGAPEHAWRDLPFNFIGCSEIEPFPCAVLEHHYPNVTNFGDMTKYREWNLNAADVDILFAGTPCQSFSVAGLRKGLDSPNGNLALVFLGMVERFAPTWVVWENVPGVLSSNGGRDFGAFLGALGQLGYGYAYRTLDAQYFGVPQRRKRVFLVGHISDWRCAAAVLFESTSLSGNITKSRKTRQKVAPAVTTGPPYSRTGNERVEADALVLARMLGFGHYIESGHTSTMLARDYKDVTDLIVPAVYENHAPLVQSVNQTTVEERPSSNSFQSSGQFNDFFVFCDTRDGDTTIHSWDIKRSTEREKEICLAVLKNRRKSKYGERDGNPLSFEDLRDLIPDLKKIELSKLVEKNFLRKEEDGKYDLKNTKNSAGIDGIYRIFLPQSSAFPTITATENKDYIALEQIFGDTKEEYKKEFISKIAPQWPAEIGNTLGADWKDKMGLNDQHINAGAPYFVPCNNLVRRILPSEAEQLQGFETGYSDITYKGKPAPDSQRYKGLGNSMAVPVVRWIGERLAAVNEVSQSLQ